MKAKVRAYTNIALIKYWGKKDEDLILPYNNSLSLSLKEFYTETEVEFRDDLEKDIFILDGHEDIKTLAKVSNFIDYFRNLKGIETRAYVSSVNHVPTAAGLASSASAFAALGGACNEALQLKLNDQELSTYIRLGSGSASRSVFGGLVEWHKGTSHETSFAEKIDDADFDIAMIAIIVNEKEKKVSSRSGMKNTVETSPYYPQWVNEAAEDLIDMKAAIKDQDVDRIGEIAEANALKMHATMMTSNPSIVYFEPKTLIAMNLVKEMRNEGITAYFTMDAGPNVKVICKSSQCDIIKERLLEEFKEEDLIISEPGYGLEVL